MKTLQDSKLRQLIAFDDKKRRKNTVLIGIDEAGRGPLCGPVVAAAAILPTFGDDIPEVLNYLNDSKKFSGNEKRREEISDILLNCGCIYGIAEGSLEDIEKHNIYQTTYLTMYDAYKQVMAQLGNKKHLVLIDGTKTIKHLDKNVVQIAIPKGDGLSASIAAASILAKVHRDNIMRKLALEFPEYNWEKNKGYGTKEHIEAIREHGRCKYHRQSFKIKGLDYEEEEKRCR